jgi:hypothetical protein
MCYVNIGISGYRNADKGGSTAKLQFFLSKTVIFFATTTTTN